MGVDDLAGRAETVRIRPMGGDGVRAARDDKARHNLAVRALDRPDAEEWLADLLDVLGLRGTQPPARPVHPSRSIQGSRITHGTRNAYSAHGCRCGDCTEANRRYQRDRRGRP